MEEIMKKFAKWRAVLFTVLLLSLSMLFVACNRDIVIADAMPYKSIHGSAEKPRCNEFIESGYDDSYPDSLCNKIAFNLSHIFLLAIENMSHAITLRLQISLIIFSRRNLDRNTFCYLYTELRELVDFIGIVRKQSHALHT